MNHWVFWQNRNVKLQIDYGPTADHVYRFTIEDRSSRIVACVLLDQAHMDEMRVWLGALPDSDIPGMTQVAGRWLHDISAT